MSERKIINRYFPPDFDPKKLDECKVLSKKNRPTKRACLKKKKLMNIRMLYPFTIRCNGCNTFHYVGTKLNSKVEKMEGITYLGIPIWRFHCRCTQCGNIIKFRTDPKSSDYKLESGATKATFEIGTEVSYNRDRSEEIIPNTRPDFKSVDELEVLKTLNKRLMNRDVTELNALKLLFRENEEINLELKDIEHSDYNELKLTEGKIKFKEFAEEDSKLISHYINKYNSCDNNELDNTRTELNLKKNKDELSIPDDAIVVFKDAENINTYLDFYNSDVE
ncbi:Yju2p/cwf16-like [Cryptosporidium ryanae]|uniref:Yju2p/cwf16-like n=1 Tax=Cryptosporidium ryanae TaxID=515981 RepID=UPI00351AAE4B|nr:Yju2p/cwf16-like [Cryptosporidium ryanae]